MSKSKRSVDGDDKSTPARESSCPGETGVVSVKVAAIEATIIVKNPVLEE